MIKMLDLRKEKMQFFMQLEQSVWGYDATIFFNVPPSLCTSGLSAKQLYTDPAGYLKSENGRFNQNNARSRSQHPAVSWKNKFDPFPCCVIEFFTQC